MNQWSAGYLSKHQGRPAASPSPGGEGLSAIASATVDRGEGGRCPRRRRVTSLCHLFLLSEALKGQKKIAKGLSAANTLGNRPPKYIPSPLPSDGRGEGQGEVRVQGENSPKNSRIEPLNRWLAGHLAKQEGLPAASPSPGGEGWGEGGRSRRSHSIPHSALRTPHSPVQGEGQRNVPTRACSICASSMSQTGRVLRQSWRVLRCTENSKRKLNIYGNV